jgi:hypothetical protein
VLRSVAEAAPRPVRELNPEVPGRLAAVIAKLHAKEPARRYQTAAEVAKVLEELLADAQHAEPPPRRRSWPRPRRRPVLAAVAVLAAALLAALFLRPNKPHGEPGTEPSARVMTPAPPVPALSPRIPDDLPKLKPVIDHDFSDASESPFVFERGKSPRVFPRKMEQHWGRETVYLFQARPGSGDRYIYDRPDEGACTNAACRLTGRIRSGGATAMTLLLAGPGGHKLGVHVWNDGKVTVEKPAWPAPALPFPRQPPIRDQAIRPGDQINELLVVIKDRQLHMFMNDRPIGQAIELPEALFPAGLEIAAYHVGESEARVQFLRYELWDLDNPQWRPPGEPPRIPADLGRLKPVIDHDFSDATKSPFVGERGKSPRVNPEWKMERQWGRETVYLFHACPGANNRCLPDSHRQRTFSNYACRLTGRITSEGLTAMTLWLGELPSVRCLGVQVWNNGELTVERLPWSKTTFALPGRKPIRDEAIRAGDQTNELLVVIQDRQLRTFVNGKRIGQGFKLPEDLSPTDVGIAAWHIGDGEARVQFLRYTLWDLDSPQGRRP